MHIVMCYMHTKIQFYGRFQISLFGSPYFPLNIPKESLWKHCVNDVYFTKNFFYLILPAHIFRTATLGCTRAIYCYAESAFNGIHKGGKKPQTFVSYTAQQHINFERMSPPPKKIMRKSKDRAYFETFGSLVHPTATFGTGYKY